MGSHPGIEALSAEVKRRFPGIGEATVYRTMRLLCDAGLAGERQFGEGFSRFEPICGSAGDPTTIILSASIAAPSSNSRIRGLNACRIVSPNPTVLKSPATGWKFSASAGIAAAGDRRDGRTGSGDRDDGSLDTKCAGVENRPVSVPRD